MHPPKAIEKRWPGKSLGVTEEDFRFHDRMTKRRRKKTGLNEGQRRRHH